MHNCGQVCGIRTWILVPRSRYADALEVASAAAVATRVGDPRDPSTVMGPLISERQHTRVEGYIELAGKEGARVVSGGSRPAHLPKGWYVEPTILGDVDNAMRVAQEEIFGPVLCIIPYDSDEDAVRIANDSRYGLGASVYTGDVVRGLALARRVRAGTVTINNYIPPSPLVPFGGFKESGIGRELGPEGLQNYLESRTISVPKELL
jgi:acyl-CoA reductase-like NAD-dependent aldehyde dehydrogenase